jgi:hypothetical protein
LRPRFRNQFGRCRVAECQRDIRRSRHQLGGPGPHLVWWSFHHCTWVTTLRPSRHPSSSSRCKKLASQPRDHAVSAAPISTTTRRMPPACWARAASGHAAAPAPKSAMNSRRLMGLTPRPRPRSWTTHSRPGPCVAANAGCSCQVRVRLSHSPMSAQCPVRPRKRTFMRDVAISHKCQKATLPVLVIVRNFWLRQQFAVEKPPTHVQSNLVCRSLRTHSSTKTRTLFDMSRAWG